MANSELPQPNKYTKSLTYLCMGKSVIVIGSGISGLAASIRLARKGYMVTVLEANDHPGGKASQIQLGGFRFDTVPSIFTLPEEIVELYELCGLKIEDHFEYRRLDTICKYFYPDGTELIGYSDKEKFIQETHEKTGEPRVNIEGALEKSAFLFENLSPLLIQKPLHKPSTWLNRNALKSLMQLPKFDLGKTMHEVNKTQFEQCKTIQLFNRYATYNGSDPFQAPATLNFIPHLEFGLGAYFPKKGMYDITRSLYNLAKTTGVKFQFGARVKRIIVHEGVAKGVDTMMGFHKADRVVSNMDAVATYKRLLKDQSQPRRLLKQPRSSSALIFYWGIKKYFPQLDLHNVFFSKDYPGEFEHIFQKESISEDPTVYLNISSTQKPDDAPEGCQNWFTMINVPHDSGQDWDHLIAQARINILKKLSTALNTDIEPLIVAESVLEPRLIEAKTSAWQGSLYGNSFNDKYAPFRRHPNFSKDIKNLYFCGGSVHPGGGIPKSLCSAKIMVDNFR